VRSLPSTNVYHKRANRAESPTMTLDRIDKSTHEQRFQNVFASYFETAENVLEPPAANPFES
jgi:hypothetical protein